MCCFFFFYAYLAENATSVHMLLNYLSALKAMAIIHSIPFAVFDCPQMKYYVKAVKMAHLISVP